MKGSRVGVILGSLVCVMAATYGATRFLHHDRVTEIDLKMSGTRCRNKVKHKIVDCDTGDTVKWEVRNRCTDQASHRVEVKFLADPCGNGSVLTTSVPADNGATVKVLSCVVEHNPGGSNKEKREYHVIGDADEDDPDIEIRGTEHFMGRLKVLLARLWAFFGR